MVRRQLRVAREQVRQDPRWLQPFWTVWLALLAVGFVVAETVALVDPGRGGTLSELVKRWAGVVPPNPRRRWAAVGLAGGLAVLAVWLIPHWTHLPFVWPWEAA